MGRRGGGGAGYITGKSHFPPPQKQKLMSLFEDLKLTIAEPVVDPAWLSILKVPDHVQYTNKFIMRGWRRRPAEILQKIPKDRRRKRCRIVPEDMPVKRICKSTHKTIGPTANCNQVPTNTEDTQQHIVNALSLMLPMDARMNIFGFWHAVVLVGVFYRHENLCWILLSRINQRLYITSHFIADSLHLFKQARSIMQVAPRQENKKWTRQGVNDALCIFPNQEAASPERPWPSKTASRSQRASERQDTSCGHSPDATRHPLGLRHSRVT